MDLFKKIFDDATEYLANIFKGAKAGTRGFNMTVSSVKSCKVNVFTKVAGKVRDVFRLDAAHSASGVPHINLNPKVNTRLHTDPHLPIPFGQAGLKASQKFARILKGVNKVLVPIAIAVDVYQGGKAIVKDVDQRTSRNTVETAVGIAGGWGGGFGGAACGAGIGSVIFPGVGTLIGGIIGGIGGGIGVGIGAVKVTELISDEFDYDIKVGATPCRTCGQKYKYRKYDRNDNGLCDYCHYKS